MELRQALGREPKIERNLSGSSGVREGHCINVLCKRGDFSENALILQTLILCTFEKINVVK